MALNHRAVQLTLATALSTGGTLAVSYPTGTSRTNFVRGVRHVLMALGAKYVSPTTITVSLGATSATITYNGTTTIPAGTQVIVSLDAGGPDVDWVSGLKLPDRVKPLGMNLVMLELGNPITADADGIFTSAAITAAAPITSGSFTGALAVSGAVSLDVPRAVVAAWTNTAVMTVTGTDEYGAVMVESSASGTSMTGVKAFKTITRVAVSANVTGCTVGIGDVLGLPVFVPGSGNLLREIEDLAAPTAGTLVAGLSQGTKATATNADVRGTYDPNSACDGSKAFSLVVWLEDPAHVGNPQFAG